MEGSLVPLREDIDRPPVAVPARFDKNDWLIAVALAGISMVITAVLVRMICHGSDAFFRSDDLWFESDTYRRYAVMIQRTTDKTVNNRHPLFSPFAFPPTRVFVLLGLSQLAAVQAVLATVAGAWIATFYALLRCMGCRRADAAIFAFLGKLTAASFFWSVVPETFSFGALTITVACLLAAADQRRTLGGIWYVLANIGTLSFSITNWMAGIAATAFRWPLRRAGVILLISLMCTAIAWRAQLLVFPNVKSHVEDVVYDMRENKEFLMAEQAGGPLDRLRSLVVHSVAMPQPELTLRASDQAPVLRVRYSPIGSGSVVGLVAAVFWLVLLFFGAFASLQLQRIPVVLRVIWPVLLGQLLLHLVYGDELFLYTFHITPLLVAIAAVGTMTRYRREILVGATVLAGCLIYNNVTQFQFAAALVDQQLTDVR